MRAASLALLAMAIAATAAIAPAQADPYVSTCTPDPPCVNVALVEKVADLYTRHTVSHDPFSELRVETGDLVVTRDDGLQLFRGTLAVPRATLYSTEAAPSALLDVDLGPAQVAFEVLGAQSYVLRERGLVNDPPVAALWVAHVEVVLADGVHYVVTTPLVVPA